MTPLEFFNRALPQAPYYSLAFYLPSDGKPDVITYNYETIEELAEHTVMHAERGANVFYSIGGFDKLPRNHENVFAVKEIAGDIDVGDGDRKYPTLEAAQAALEEFCDAVNLPHPLMICSGGGLHFHWLLTEQISRVTYTEYAIGLKALAEERLLRIDAATVGNASQLLRPPGTSNYKLSQVRPVYVLKDAPAIHVDLLSPIVESYKSAIARKWVDRNPYDPNDSFNFDRGHISFMAKRCLVAKQYEIDGLGSEGYEAWRSMLTNAARCEGGDAWAHEHGAKCPAYKPVETQQKLDHGRAFAGGPVTCEHIKQNTNICQLCPYLGRITSPVQLAIDDKQLAGPKPRKLPPSFAIEGGYLMNNKLKVSTAWVMKYHYKVEDRDDTMIECEGPLGPFVVEPNDILREPACTVTMLKHRIAVIEPKLHHTYVQQSLDTASFEDGHEIPVAFGWKDNYAKLQHGEYIITKDGIERHAVAPEIGGMARFLRPTTDASGKALMDVEARIAGFKAQCEALRPIFDAKYEQQTLLLPLSLAGLFLAIIGEAHGGVIVAPVSTESATGKTTGAQAALSLHSNLTGLTLSAQGSEIAMFRHMGILRHYPSMIDEAERSDAASLTRLLQTFTYGRDKERLTQTGATRGLPGHWCTMPIHPSNTAPLNAISGLANFEAMAERVIEIPFDLMNMPTATSTRFNSKLMHAAGWFSPVFVEMILRENLVPHIRHRALELAEEIGVREKFTNKHRFKTEALGMAWAIGEIVEAKKLLPFNIKHQIDRLCALLHAQHLRYQPVNAWSLIGNLLHNHMSSFFYVGTPNIPLNGSVYGRVEPGGIMAIRVDFLKAELAKNKANYSEIVHKLHAAGRVLIDRPALYNILEGSPRADAGVATEVIWLK